MDIDSITQRFGVHTPAKQLRGGTTPTFKAKGLVFKRVKETSLENNHSPQLMAWIAELSHTIKQDGFRFPVAKPTVAGQWITDNGWSAWSFVEGKHAHRNNVKQCIEGIIAFHKAIKDVPRHPLMVQNDTPWGVADKACWGRKVASIAPEVVTLVETLYSLRKPVDGLDDQLIHGDLNPENILISPNLPPAFIDFSPFWRPVEFALAMFANWIGPRQGDVSVLEHFSNIKSFDQMLLRASIRMLLIMNNFSTWKTSSEKRSAELVIEYLRRK